MWSPLLSQVGVFGDRTMQWIVEKGIAMLWLDLHEAPLPLCLLLFAAYFQICKKIYSFSGVVFLFSISIFLPTIYTFK